MVTLRKVLSLPMFATALALAWLLGRQTGVDGMALGLLVLSLFAVSLWWYGLRQGRGSAGWLTLAPASLALRSEEHTSELQSLMRISYAVFCLKKKRTTI